MWIDTHCHLDAPEFDADRDAVVARARAAGVTQIVIPAIEPGNFERVRELAHHYGLSYALGVHPLFVAKASDDDLKQLGDNLRRALDPRLVAIGEIGLDHFVAGSDLQRQTDVLVVQLRLAREFDLPVLLHSRRAVDVLLKHLRQQGVRRGIAHAFNGSEQQAEAFVSLGFKLGFGGALTFERALQIRRIARWAPADAIVLETDAPDIPPYWLYRTAAERAEGQRARNEPGELSRIAEALSELRAIAPAELARCTLSNARAALPRLP